MVAFLLLASIATITRKRILFLVLPAPLDLRWPLACVLFLIVGWTLNLVFLELPLLDELFWGQFLIIVHAGGAGPTARLLSLNSKKVLTRTLLSRDVINFPTYIICLQPILNVLRDLLRDILASSDDLLRTLETGRLLATQDLLDMLAGLFSFLYVELLQAFVKLIYIWNRLVYNSPTVVFAEFDR